MNEKEFSRCLSELTQKAKSQGFCLSMQDISKTFPQLIENEEQMKLLLEYLKGQKISVGDQLEVEEYLSLEDKQYLDAYLLELEEIEKMSQDELRQIILSATTGDEDAQQVVLIQFLSRVVELAKLYSGQGVLLEDLIGEGNLALAQGVMQLGCIDTDTDLLEEAQGFLGKIMMDAMETLINEELGEKEVDAKMAEHVNRVADSAKELSEMLRRPVTVAELAENTALSEESIRRAMKDSGNQIKELIDPDADQDAR